MILKNISIIGYKNIRECKIELSDKLNCFIGHNGEGKTNFLDAIYYLSFCRSAFNSIDSQLILHGENFFILEGLYKNENDITDEIYCGMKRGSKKHFKRNKKEYKRLSQHIGFIPLVFISPSDELLITGGSEERRAFMDVVISQYDIEYIDALTKYNKVLKQRNSILKQDEEPDSALMDILEAQMSSEGEKIYQKRKTFIEEFIPVFQNIYEAISNAKEKVSLNYISHCQRGSLLDVIRCSRSKDLAVGYSLHGTHRDDLEMTLNGYQMKKEGSQGQNKTYILAMKLAQFNFLKRTISQTTPLLLLDDIFDKLDAGRVEQIVKLVSSNKYGQIFITDTNREHLDKILKSSKSEYKLFNVSNGEINV